MVYDDLRRIARSRAGVGGAGQTLQPTVLVNEALCEILRRMDSPEGLPASSRTEFFGIVASAMRTIVKDHHRARRAAKRGGGERPSPLLGDEPDLDDTPFGRVDLMALDESLNRLERYEPRWHQVVLYRFYAGRTIEQTAELLGAGVTLVKADWRGARAWLARDLGSGH
jgi:RNA polymerase sigma factor (TIGR02999 family)